MHLTERTCASVDTPIVDAQQLYSCRQRVAFYAQQPFSDVSARSRSAHSERRTVARPSGSGRRVIASKAGRADLLAKKMAGLARTNQRSSLARKHEGRLDGTRNGPPTERAFAQCREEIEQHAYLHLRHTALAVSLYAARMEQSGERLYRKSGMRYHQSEKAERLMQVAGSGRGGRG